MCACGQKKQKVSQSNISLDINVLYTTILSLYSVHSLPLSFTLYLSLSHRKHNQPLYRTLIYCIVYKQKHPIQWDILCTSVHSLFFIRSACSIMLHSFLLKFQAQVKRIVFVSVPRPRDKIRKKHLILTVCEKQQQ